MAQFIVNKKIYNTDTAQQVVTYQKGFPINFIPSLTLFRPATLYKTLNGNWFTTCDTGTGKLSLFEETEETARQILTDLNEVEAYNKHLGKLEEA